MTCARGIDRRKPRLGGVDVGECAHLRAAVSGDDLGEPHRLRDVAPAEDDGDGNRELGDRHTQAVGLQDVDILVGCVPDNEKRRADQRSSEARQIGTSRIGKLPRPDQCFGMRRAMADFDPRCSSLSHGEFVDGVRANVVLRSSRCRSERPDLFRSSE